MLVQQPRGVSTQLKPLQAVPGGGGGQGGIYGGKTITRMCVKYVTTLWEGLEILGNILQTLQREEKTSSKRSPTKRIGASPVEEIPLATAML